MLAYALTFAVLLLASVGVLSLAHAGELLTVLLGEARHTADETVMRWRLRHVRTFGGPDMYARHAAAYRAARVPVTVGDPGDVTGPVVDGELL